jgi:hypothetical protein
VLGGAVLLTGIGIGASNSKTTTTTAEAPPAASAQAAPAQPAPAAPAPAPAPEGSAKMVIGQPVTLTRGGKALGTITVTDVKQVAKPANDFVGSPKHGTYWVASVTHTATDEMSYSLLDWKIKDDAGQQYTSSFFDATDEPSLSSGTLRAGEKASGTVTFDAPKAGSSLVLSPMFSGKSLATMALAAS